MPFILICGSGVLRQAYQIEVMTTSPTRLAIFWSDTEECKCSDMAVYGLTYLISMNNASPVMSMLAFRFHQFGQRP